MNRNRSKHRLAVLIAGAFCALPLRRPRAAEFQVVEKLTVNGGISVSTAPGATPVIFASSVTNPGNVGIGTASPAYPLDVNGTSRTGDMIVTGKLRAGTWQAVYENTLSAAATSVSVSGLAGDTDLIYKIYYSVVNGSGGAGTIRIRLNNDSGNNYSWNRIAAQGSTPGGQLSASDSGIFAGAYTQANDLVTDEAVIFSKSGINRGFQSYSNTMAANTANAEIDLIFGQWKNSTDEVTSIDIVAYPANGLGAGSYIRVETVRR
jgi:hypothetical protein